MEKQLEQMNDEAELLRDVADLVLSKRLDGCTFPEKVDQARHMQGQDAPELVRRLANRIRFRGAALTPEGVACVLRGAAIVLERGTNGSGSSGDRIDFV